MQYLCIVYSISETETDSLNSIPYLFQLTLNNCCSQIKVSSEAKIIHKIHKNKTIFKFITVQCPSIYIKCSVNQNVKYNK